MKNKDANNRTGISPWAVRASELADSDDQPPLFQQKAGDFTFTASIRQNGLWITADKKWGGVLAFRAAYIPEGELSLQKLEEAEHQVHFFLQSSVGKINVLLQFPEPELPFFRYTTTLKPKLPLLLPFFPRDIVPLAKKGNGQLAEGEIHAHQVGPRSGLLYMSMTKPKTGSLFYFQNLSALSDYCEDTETSVAETVGGHWPELGFALPPAQEKPLIARKEYVISDAFILLSPDIPEDEFVLSKQFLDMLAQIYLHLPLPETQYPDWPNISQKSLFDLQNCPGCWNYVQGNAYLNAYVSSYDTPPESMVQLAVLLPLLEYVQWSGEELDMVKKLESVLPNFYDERIGCIVRWLLAREEEVDGSEEHKKPRVMDSWYLYHPLLNLSRMAIKGDKTAKKLFLSSLDYAIKVARHFEYKWPIFYNLDTLEVIKAESKPGEGGERDVPGTYAHIMLQAYELTKEERYLNEAKKAAKALQGVGFKLFYQANNTAFTSGAMLRLWKITGNELYLNLSYLCVANMFVNMWLWECNYGHGKYHPSFFALFPLADAPYTAVYEEQEGFAAFNDFLARASGEEILPSVTLLLSEFIRIATYKTTFYYPPLLPKEILSTEVRSGEIGHDLWIPIEDMSDGWEPCGKVGQEVYGAGLAFGILTRQYMRVPGESFLIFVDYPTSDKKLKEGQPVSFQLGGDARLVCRMRLIPNAGEKLPDGISVMGEKQGEEQQRHDGQQTKEGHLEYLLHGNQKITINWDNNKNGKPLRRKAKKETSSVGEAG